jgi:hypothetical protein
MKIISGACRSRFGNLGHELLAMDESGCCQRKSRQRLNAVPDEHLQIDAVMGGPPRPEGTGLVQQEARFT